MLGLFRNRVPSVATALVLALGVTAGAFSNVLHARAEHDAECDTVVAVVHDAADHGMRGAEDAAAADAHPLHCVTCHSVRHSRPLSTASSDGPEPARTAALPGEPASRVRTAALTQVPPRAPPAATLV